MRIAVISDLHGNMDAVSGMMGSIEDADRIICLGDVVGIGPDPAEVLETVLDDERISWVLGNHDVNTRDGTELGPLREIKRRPHHEWVRGELGDLVLGIEAPMSLSLEASGRTLTFMHRHPDDCGSAVPYFDHPFPSVLDDFYSDVEGDILFFGHTHIPLMVSGSRLYVNPGAVGAENGGIASAVILDAEDGMQLAVRRVRYDLEAVRKRLREKAAPYYKYISAHFFSEKGYTPSPLMISNKTG